MDKEKSETRTDVVLNMENIPFLALTESCIPNVWYHDELDYLFSLSSMGFKVIKGNKEQFEKKWNINKTTHHNK